MAMCRDNRGYIYLGKLWSMEGGKGANVCNFIYKDDILFHEMLLTFQRRLAEKSLGISTELASDNRLNPIILRHCEFPSFDNWSECPREACKHIP